MRSLVLVSLLLSLGLPITAAVTNAVPLPSGPLTLDQALEFALAHNVTLRKGRQDLEEAQGLAIQQRAARLPRLATTGAYQQLDEGRIERVQFSAAQPATPFLNNQSWNANLVVTQPIYAGGKYNSMARSSRLTREAALASYQALVANTLLEVRTADSLKAEPFDVSVGVALNAAWVRRPEIKVAQSASQLRHEEVLQTRADLLPSVSGIAGYGVQNRNFVRDIDRTLDGWTVGVQANWMLFDFGQTQAKVNMARAREERARLEVEDVRRRIELEVRTAFSLFMESKEVLVSQTRVIEQAEEAVRLVTARADAGSSTQLEVLSAQTALKLSRTQYSQALRDYTVARAKLERAMGEGVRLVVETGSR